MSMIHTSHPKEYNIFLLINDVVSMMNGGHVIMCKSGKDRTSMSVTFQQVNSLYKNHNISGEQRSHLIDCMRSCGIRLSVAEKNTGTAKYAFNSLQRSFLYSPFRPPSDIVDDKIQS